MELKEVLSNLCSRDKRNPDWNDLYGDWEEVHGEGTTPPEPRADDCYCDNCFGGSDKLALEILRLIDLPPTVESIKSGLATLTNEEREDCFLDYCQCGSAKLPCYCCNDE